MIETFVIGIVSVAYILGFVMGHRTGQESGAREMHARLTKVFRSKTDG